MKIRKWKQLFGLMHKYMVYNWGFRLKIYKFECFILKLKFLARFEHSQNINFNLLFFHNVSKQKGLTETIKFRLGN